jgi:hypothetical protein
MTKISKAKSRMPKIRNRRSAEFSHSQFLAQNAGVSKMEQLSFIGMYAAGNLLRAMALGNFDGATTFSIMAISIMTLGVTTYNIMTLSIMILRLTLLRN